MTSQLAVQNIRVFDDNFWEFDWRAPGLTETLFLGGSYLQGKENIAHVQTIEVLAGVP